MRTGRPMAGVGGKAVWIDIIGFLSELVNPVVLHQGRSLLRPYDYRFIFFSLIRMRRSPLPV